jgi:hypothetical protein
MLDSEGQWHAVCSCDAAGEWMKKTNRSKMLKKEVVTADDKHCG